MSTSYVICPPTANSGLQVDSTYLAEKIKLRWPQAQVEILHDPNTSYILRWQLSSERFSLMGGLQSKQEAITIESIDGSSIAEFVAWYRSIIPSQYKLIFFVSSMNKPPIELKVDTNAQSILDELA